MSDHFSSSRKEYELVYTGPVEGIEGNVSGVILIHHNKDFLESIRDDYDGLHGAKLEVREQT